METNFVEYKCPECGNSCDVDVEFEATIDPQVDNKILVSTCCHEEIIPEMPDLYDVDEYLVDKWFRY